MTKRIEKHGLQVDKILVDFIEGNALEGTGVNPDVFWAGLSDLAHDLGPKNRALLAEREEMQGKIDAWHRAHKAGGDTRDAYFGFLREIGYLLPEGNDFQIDTTNVDPEIATTPGPQLVVPVTNARFALNAANARWGSLYDGFYGTDVMGSAAPKGAYDKGRGARVVARARVFLDETFPISGASHADVRRYHVHDGALLVDDLPLSDPSQFIGYQGHPKAPSALILRNNGLHVELVFDRTHPIGQPRSGGARGCCAGKCAVCDYGLRG